MGVLLGYLSRRVLGQYNIALLGREQVDTGKLYYVEPNIRHIETTLDCPQTISACGWPCTRRRTSSSSKVFPGCGPTSMACSKSISGYLKDDAALLGQGLKNLRVFVERARSGDSNSSWIEHLMNEKQRELFNRMQTMMSVIEGYSNHVMNAVGRDLLENYEPISRKFEYRQANKSQAELLAKLTGLDMKMEQYRLGEQFIDAIAIQRGHAFAVKVWDGPEMLPTPEELRKPDLWIARVDRQQSEALAPDPLNRTNHAGGGRVHSPSALFPSAKCRVPVKIMAIQAVLAASRTS